MNTISKPLQLLEKTINAAADDIEAWFRRRFQNTPPPFYCSVDLRNNGNKIAPIDTNLFPGGFNNLPAENAALAAEALAHGIDRHCAGACTVLLIMENHTRNAAYMENIATLKRLLAGAGFPVSVGRLDGQTLTHTLADGEVLTMHPVSRRGRKLHCGGGEPCLAVLNNDLSGGVPAVLQDTDTPVLPPPTLGWSQRRKSDHFFRYQRIVADFAELIKTDPWLLMADFHICPQVNFRRREGLECLAAAVEETLSQISEKYRQHNIDNEPYVVIKANAGTYGMGVITLKTADEVFRLNRRQRNQMSVGKEGVPIHDVMIQEGIHTIDRHNAAAAEPVVYMIGGTVVGGFFRVNEQRGSGDNLNSGGMSFSPLPFKTATTTTAMTATAGSSNNDGGDSSSDSSDSNVYGGGIDDDGSDAQARLYVYGVIARLAATAAAEETAAA